MSQVILTPPSRSQSLMAVVIVTVGPLDACRNPQCKRKLDARERSGLCRHCQDDPAVRARFPAYCGSMRPKEQQPPPARLYRAPPGPLRVEELEMRAARGEELFPQADIDNDLMRPLFEDDDD